MQDRHATEKRDQLRAMLEQGLVMIHLDPRGTEVVVPPQFKAQPMLRLNLAYAFNLPALDIDDEGIYAILSFNRANFGCTIPWSAIFAMTWPDAEHDGFVWPDSAPRELAAAFSAPMKPASAPRPAPAVARSEPLDEAAPPEDEPRPRPIFIVHEGGRKGDAPPPPETDDQADPPARPKLRLVKG